MHSATTNPKRMECIGVWCTLAFWIVTLSMMFQCARVGVQLANEIVVTITLVHIELRLLVGAIAIYLFVTFPAGPLEINSRLLSSS